MRTGFIFTETDLEEEDNEAEFSNAFNNEGIFYCHFCTICCPSMKALLKHLEEVHNDHQNSDYYTSSNQPELISKELSSAQSYECGICDITFTVKHKLSNHFHKLHKSLLRKRLMCRHCKKALEKKTFFTTKKELLAHFDRCHNIRLEELLLCYCGMKFSNASDLSVHMGEAHSDNSNPFMCGHCGNSFMTKDRVKSHMFGIHKCLLLEKLGCKLCQDELEKYIYFISKEEYDGHLVMSHQQNKIITNLDTTLDGWVTEKSESIGVEGAENALLLDIDLDQDLRLILNEDDNKEAMQSSGEDITEEDDLKELQCRECDKTFKYKSSLISHERAHVNMYQRECIPCNKKYYRIESYKNHLAVVHSHDYPFQCFDCDERFKLKVHLSTHIKRHHLKSRFSCEQCGQQFAYKKNLVEHQQRKHTTHPLITCSLCTKGFHVLRDFKLHMASAHAEPLFPCETCGKKFTTKKVLNNHKRVHEDDFEKKYTKECSICNKRVRNLKKHTHDFHENEGKHFICDICGKACREKSALKLHLMVHNDIKPHLCPHCGKKFLTNHHMLQHSRQHTGAATFECSYCDKKLTSKRALEAHQRLHFGIRPFQCELCKMAFHDKKYLLRHKKEKHTQPESKVNAECD